MCGGGGASWGWGGIYNISELVIGIDRVGVLFAIMG